jgi:hypothetical protein
VTLGDSVTGAFPAVKVTLAVTPFKVGGWLTAVMLTVVVAVVLRLFEAPPLLSTQVMVRLGSEP